jgi:hypothetical protein
MKKTIKSSNNLTLGKSGFKCPRFKHVVKGSPMMAS